MKRKRIRPEKKIEGKEYNNYSSKWQREHGKTTHRPGEERRRKEVWGKQSRKQYRYGESLHEGPPREFSPVLLGTYKAERDCECATDEDSE